MKKIDKDLTIILLLFAWLITAMVVMISFRVIGEDQKKIDNLQYDVYAANLKRDFYIYRDNTSIGHNKDSTTFPRYQELINLSNNRPKK